MDRLEVKAQFTVDDAGTIEGLAWPFGTADLVGDVIERGAFAKAVAPLPMLDTHDPSKIIGVWDQITETAEGLQVKGRLMIDDVARAREVRSFVKAGVMRGLSVGFRKAKSMPRQPRGRTISELELVEISVCRSAVNPGAGITHAKGGDMPDPVENPEITTLKSQVAELEKKVDTGPLLARLEKLETKSARPDPGDKKDEPSLERKAFATYLRLGNNIAEEDKKALITSVDTQGGYLAPPELSSEIIRDLVEFSPIRSYASISSTGSPSVVYPTRGDLTNAKWVGETQTREESEITFGQKEIAVKELATFVDISNRLLADAPQAETEVRLALAEDFGKKEAHAFLWGEGVLQPSGLMRNTDIAEVANGHAGSLSPDALVKLLYSMPQAYRNSGAWAMNGTTLGIIRTLKDGDGRFLWQPSFQLGQPETILGRPVIEMVDMPNIASGEFPIIYGDFKGYRILDREGMSILVDPYTRATNGITRVHATRRVGGAVLQAARFRKLKMATS